MKSESQEKSPRKPNVLERLFLDGTVGESPGLVPGVLFAVLLVVAVIWLTDAVNAALGFSGLISPILVVILVGILIRNLLTIPAVCGPGISFCLKKLLRLGIILMGIRLSIFDVLRIGGWGIPIVVVCVLGGLLISTCFGRLLKVSGRLSTLIAVGTGICGASAIVATAPGIEARDEEVTYAVANITVFGILALIAYPFIAQVLFHGDITLIGLFTGTSIHETAQVAASGLIYDQTFGVTASPTAADIAVVTKLVRNTLMALVIPAMTFVYARRRGLTGSEETGYRKVLKLFPVFILGFILLAVVRSLGDAGLQETGRAFWLWSADGWRGVTGTFKDWSGYVLATAMAGVGLGTSFRSMKGLGIRPFIVGLGAAVTVGLVAIVMVLLLGPLVNV
ncbi:MAG: putative sulfate exporter family transporter [Chloroflexota bacterium]